MTLTAGELVVVQDDLLHPVLGGNKLRKLDGLLPEVKATGCTDLVSSDSLQKPTVATCFFLYPWLLPAVFLTVCS